MNAYTVINIPVCGKCQVTVKAFQGYGMNKLKLQASHHDPESKKTINDKTVNALSDIVSVDTVEASIGTVTLTALANTYIEWISVVYR